MTSTSGMTKTRRGIFASIMHRRATPMEKYLAAIILGYIIIVSIRNPLFFSAETLFDMIRSASAPMILALGAMMALISGGIDVSFTAVAIVSGYLAVKILLATGIDNVFLAIVLSMCFGLILGAINAVLIHFLKLPTLIITLGTMSVYVGLMAVIVGTHSYPPAEMPKSLIWFGSLDMFSVTTERGRFGLTVFLPIVIALIILTWFVLYRTMLGRSIYAMGSNEESASRLGINLFGTKLFVYCYVGAVSALGGIIYFSELKYVNPTSLVGSELMIIAAVVIGGTLLTGGEGTILGAVLGVVIFRLFQSTLVFLGLNSSWNGLFFGGVLLISLIVMYRRKRITDERNLVFG